MPKASNSTTSSGTQEPDSSAAGMNGGQLIYEDFPKSLEVIILIGDNDDSTILKSNVCLFICIVSAALRSTLF